jgi:hypothetical protein
MMPTSFWLICIPNSLILSSHLHTEYELCYNHHPTICAVALLIR